MSFFEFVNKMMISNAPGGNRKAQFAF